MTGPGLEELSPARSRSTPTNSRPESTSSLSVPTASERRGATYVTEVNITVGNEAKTMFVWITVP